MGYKVQPHEPFVHIYILSLVLLENEEKRKEMSGILLKACILILPVSE